MHPRLSYFLPVLCALALGTAAEARDRDRAVYREPNEYPVLDEIEARRDSLAAAVDALRAAADSLFDAQAEAREDTDRSLRVDWSRIERPASPEAFRTRLAHLPPVPQYYTGSCWAFAATSLMESETIRLTGDRIKLSEMWLVYWEYVEKVRRWVREYGHSAVAEGSESDAILDVYKAYGAVPHAAYPGVLFADGRHDHHRMMEELEGYLDWAETHDVWDEQRVVAGARRILDAHLGPPPETFTWEGRKWSPRAFLLEALRLDLDAYVACVSFMERPGYAFGETCLLDVTDNWRRKADYLNLPLDEFRRLVREAVRRGYTLVVGGDNSEPGMDGHFDAAVIPSWDIPADYIDQAAREHRIRNGETGDDHGIHVVGHTRAGDRDWYLLKDSNRSSRLGAFEGYYFCDGDYIALKMLSVLVHRDVLRQALPNR
ncbi:C1 family peptidase [bacterium]|nr:C1 family peptidase [bacterium]MBU1072879.1 C1 family peptidase [bacterium]MBU1675111.1 C1 family peptidase [bacterium]